MCLVREGRTVRRVPKAESDPQGNWVQSDWSERRVNWESLVCLDTRGDKAPRVHSVSQGSPGRTERREHGV